ncbi:hypothetical protein PCS8203_01318 [Streptococcus pneumoniae PCS8203]|nr:hypothetical protein PCS8203_01318 [Streptococcus pneumoniae PCS8203]ELU60436.1 hypothetical protein PCS8106_00128 [Streptococcus pneumoniae PCS8106]
MIRVKSRYNRVKNRMILEWEVMMIPMTVPNIMDKRTDRMDISIVTPNPCKILRRLFP